MIVVTLNPIRTIVEKFAESNQSQSQQQQEPKHNVHKEQVQGNKLKQNYIQGRLNNVDLITTHGAKEVVYGLIVVSSYATMVLFDPSASHSFISREYVEDHKITMLPMRKPMIVKSPRGVMKANPHMPKS